VADRTKIASDEEDLERYYRRLGYFDARVDHLVEYQEGGKFVDVTFAISEGKQYFVNEISVTGNKYHTAEELLKNMQLKVNEPFIQDKMEYDARLLREIYGAQGFIFVDITPTPVYLPNERLNLIYQIEEGDIYRASDIHVNIAGDSSFTKHRVVLNMMGNRLRPGQIIDAREIENAERRLRFSQIFETNPAEGDPPRIEVLPFAKTAKDGLD
jgi:outer membrane protein insertion porin family